MLIPCAVKAQNTSPQGTPIGDTGFVFSGYTRVRYEQYDWFGTPRADGSYGFVGGILRLNATKTTPKSDFQIELAVPFLAGLPTQAFASAPIGLLGQGANYRDANGGQVASAFLKQGWVRFKQFGAKTANLRAGRFEFSDGAETTPTDSTLAWLKQNRIAQRLIGPFTFTHVGRSFDGVQWVNNAPKQNTTLLAAFPTRGVFDLDGWDTLTDVGIAYGALTFPLKPKRGEGEARLFGAIYTDGRDLPTKTDNRPLAIRAADKDDIALYTLGAHALRTLPIAGGTADLLAWGAGQFGRWGSQKHGAYSYALEAGWQANKAAWKPWVRVGYSVASGDGDPSNNTHGTFVPLLNTPRIYARYPFFTQSNLKDGFVQLILQPSKQWTIRADAHALNLAKKRDLWYTGGGAFDNKNFGFAGRPSNGHVGLATLYDVSVDYSPRKETIVSLYAAYARGGAVVNNLFAGPDSFYGFLEIQQKF